MKSLSINKILDLFIFGLLIVMGLTVIYSDESYLDLLALIDTGGNGKLNLLTYPLSLYLICAVTCIGYLRTKQTKYLDFLVLMWTSVLIARIISIFARGGVVVDIYFYVGILPEFIIAPFFFFLRNNINRSSQDSF
jgi:hypothetical protein